MWLSNPFRIRAWLAMLVACAIAIAEPSLGLRRAYGQAALETESPVETFAPRQARSELDGDRRQAEALFAAGRTAFQQHRFEDGLKNYERAARLDPTSQAILKRLVPLALAIDRPAEAVRYAVASIDDSPLEAPELAQLAAYLSDQGEYGEAARFYDRAIARFEAETSGRDAKAALVALWLEAGRVAFLGDQPRVAARYFSRVMGALERPTDFGVTEASVKSLLRSPALAYQLFGETFLAADQTAAAAKAFAKANELEPNPAALVFNQARIDAREHRAEQALAELEQSLDAHVDRSRAAYDLLDQLLEELGRGQKFMARLEELYSADPRNETLALYLADAYRDARQSAMAEGIYLSLIEDPNSPLDLSTCRRLVEIYQANQNANGLLKVLGRVAESAGTLRVLEGGGDSDSLAKSKVGDGVIALAQSGIKQQPRKLTAGEQWAAALLAAEREQFDVAGEFFKSTIAADETKAVDVLQSWGVELLIAERYAEAAPILERALTKPMKPATTARLNYFLATALEMSGQSDAGIDAARKAGEQQPDDPQMVGRLGWIQFHAKRYDDARASQLEMLKRFDGMRGASETRIAMQEARLLLSNIDVARGDLASAEEWLEQVLDEFPDDAGALNDLGYLWADGGKHRERAFQMIARAVTAEPSNKAFRDSLGWALYRLDRPLEATIELESAAAVDNPEPVVLEHLGDAQFAAADRTAAIDTWSRALKAFDKQAAPEKARAVQDKIDRARQVVKNTLDEAK